MMWRGRTGNEWQRLEEQLSLKAFSLLCDLCGEESHLWLQQSDRCSLLASHSKAPK